MDISVNSGDTMNLASLPIDTTLYKLLSDCDLDHELVLTECADGAMFMECFDCPFKRLLDEREEEHLREQQAEVAVK